MVQEGESVIMNWIFQSFTGGTESGNNLGIVDCYRRDSV